MKTNKNGALFSGMLVVRVLTRTVAVLVALLFTASSFAQVKTKIPVGTPNQASVYTGAVGADSAILLPTGCNVPSVAFGLRYTNLTRKSLMYADTCAGKLYYFRLGANEWSALADSAELGTITWDRVLSNEGGEILLKDHEIDGGGFTLAFVNNAEFRAEGGTGDVLGTIQFGDPVYPARITANTANGNNSDILLGDSIRYYSSTGKHVFDNIETGSAGYNIAQFSDINHLTSITQGAFLAGILGDYLSMQGNKIRFGSTVKGTADPSITLPGSRGFFINRSENSADQTIGLFGARNVVKVFNGTASIGTGNFNTIYQIDAANDTLANNTNLVASGRSITSFLNNSLSRPVVNIVFTGKYGAPVFSPYFDYTELDTVNHQTWNFKGEAPLITGGYNVPFAGGHDGQVFYNTKLVRDPASTFVFNNPKLYDMPVIPHTGTYTVIEQHDSTGTLVWHADSIKTDNTPVVSSAVYFDVMDASGWHGKTLANSIATYAQLDSVAKNSTIYENEINRHVYLDSNSNMLLVGHSYFTILGNLLKTYIQTMFGITSTSVSTGGQSFQQCLFRMYGAIDSNYVSSVYFYCGINAIIHAPTNPAVKTYAYGSIVSAIANAFTKHYYAGNDASVTQLSGTFSTISSGMTDSSGLRATKVGGLGIISQSAGASISFPVTVPQSGGVFINTYMTDGVNRIVDSFSVFDGATLLGKYSFNGWNPNENSSFTTYLTYQSPATVYLPNLTAGAHTITVTKGNTVNAYFMIDGYGIVNSPRNTLPMLIGQDAHLPQHYLDSISIATGTNLTNKSIDTMNLAIHDAVKLFHPYNVALVANQDYLGTDSTDFGSDYLHPSASGVSKLTNAIGSRVYTNNPVLTLRTSVLNAETIVQQFTTTQQNFVRYHQIRSTLTATAATNILSFYVHTGAANTVTNALSLRGNQTVGIAAASGTGARLNFPVSTTGLATMNFATGGAAKTSPVEGDWSFISNFDYNVRGTSATGKLAINSAAGSANGQVGIYNTSTGLYVPALITGANGIIITNGAGSVGASLTDLTPTGNLTLALTKKVTITTGTNASAGTATLSSGTVTVSTTAVTASSLIFVQYSGNPATVSSVLTVPTKTAGTSFVITALTPGTTTTATTDANVVQWWIIN